MLIAIVGFFLLLSIVPAPGGFRLRSASLAALILLGWLLDPAGKASRRRKVARAVAATLAAGALLVVLHSWLRSRPEAASILTAPQGRIAFTRDDLPLFEEYSWIEQHTRQHDDVYEAIYPGIYFYLDLKDPTPLNMILSHGYTTQSQVADVIQSLEQRKVGYVLWEPAALNDRPVGEGAADDTLQPLREYLYSHYTLAKEFGTGYRMTQVWASAGE
jgi:hypothetical protein